MDKTTNSSRDSSAKHLPNCLDAKLIFLNRRNSWRNGCLEFSSEVQPRSLLPFNYLRAALNLPTNISITNRYFYRRISNIKKKKNLVKLNYTKPLGIFLFYRKSPCFLFLLQKLTDIFVPQFARERRSAVSPTLLKRIFLYFCKFRNSAEIAMNAIF